MEHITPKVLNFYYNVKPFLDLPKGCIWAHIQYSDLLPTIGNKGYGALVYCWTEKGDCQNGWCGGTFIIPGQYVESEHFKVSRIKGKVPSFLCNNTIDTTITFSDGKTKRLSLDDFYSLLAMEDKNV